jgi:hypothetical protein
MFSILTFIAVTFFSLHPIHVSVTEISYDERDKELEIISRIFIDDLEVAIRQVQNKPELNLLTPGADTSIDKLVSAYLQSRFKIKLDGKEQKVVYLGHEIENEAILCYIQVPNIKKWKSIEVANTVITELHDDQSNLVHVTVRGSVKSLRLMQNNPSGKLTFDVK